MELKHEPEVRLVWRTPNPKRVIATAARMTYSAKDVEVLMDDMTDKQIDDSVNAILERRHYSCLRHVVFCFTIAGVSRAFSHQLVRHTAGHSYEQRSQHYRNESGFRLVVPPTFDDDYTSSYKLYAESVEGIYDEMVNDGIPKEDARMILPNGVETQLIWTANLEALMNMIKARACRLNCSEINMVATRVRHLIMNSIPEMGPYLGPTCWTQGMCFEGDKFYRECKRPWKTPTALWRPEFPRVIELVKVGGTASLIKGVVLGGPNENPE